MRRMHTKVFIGAALLFACCGCGTMFNLNGKEPWLLGEAPKRPIDPFGGVNNDVRILSRFTPTDCPDLCFIAAVAGDTAFSSVGDLITLPWTSYRWYCSGGLHSNQVTWKTESAVPMKATLLQHIPLGTGLQEARKFMEGEGFACTLRRNDTFIERRANDPGPKHEGIDFLACERVQNETFLRSRVWRVALVLKNGLVTDVIVDDYFDGP
jgi:hypothetical protein